MKKRNLVIVSILVCVLVLLNLNTVYAAKKIKIYAVHGTLIETFKVSKGKLLLRSKEKIDCWDYGDGYDYWNGKKIKKKTIKFKVSDNCKWTYSWANDPDRMIRQYTSYKHIKAMADSCLEDDVDVGYLQVRVYVKNKKVIRVDAQTE